MNLKSMSIDRLIDLRQRVNAALKTARLWINVEHSNPSFQSSLAFAVARRGQNQSDLVLGEKLPPNTAIQNTTAKPGPAAASVVGQ